MREGFEHLRCPMCGGELIYSEGTHDLCCVKNPYESAAARGEGGGLHEERAEYGGVEDAHIYKVWGEGGGERLARWNVTEHGRENTGAAGMIHDAGSTIQDDAKENEVSHCAVGASAGATDNSRTSDTTVKGHSHASAAHGKEFEEGTGDADNAADPDSPAERHGCVFAVSFTESARFGTLWSVRVVHGEINYFALMRLMQKIEKRRAAGEPLAANAPHQPKRRERSPAAKLAFRFGIEEEDVYSIRFSSETVKRLAVFYGIPERDVKRIREEELGEE